MSIDRRTSKQSKCISCRTKTNSWIHLFVTVQQTKIKLQYFSKTHKYIKQNPLTWQQFRNLLLPTQKWSAVWAPISSKRYSIGIHSWHPSFPWHCMAIMRKKRKEERIGCFYQCHLTAQLLPSPLNTQLSPMHQWRRTQTRCDDSLTDKGSRHTTNKAHVLWTGPSKNSHSKPQ